jgi:DNA-binding MarR family transcriptional regulator
MMTSEKLEVSQILSEQIHSQAIHLLRRLRREDGSSGLSAPRLSALSVIVFGGPVTLGDLAEAEQVQPPTMTRIVNALEEQGLVRKIKNAKDGRSTHLSATKAGKKLLIEGRERRVRALSKQIVALNEKDRAVLQQAAQLLERVIEAI